MGTRRSLTRSREASLQLEAERDAWRQRAEKLLRGLGDEIDAQLHAGLEALRAMPVPFDQAEELLESVPGTPGR